MKKYFLVIPGAALIFLGSMWLIFGSYMSEDDAAKGKANMELPEGDSNELQGNKLKAVAEQARREEDERNDSIMRASLMPGDTIGTDTVAPVSNPSPIEQSPMTYQQVQASLDDFYVPENTESAQVAELQARIEELEEQNALARQQSQQPDQMEMLERSYQLAAQYMGNGGNCPPPARCSAGLHTSVGTKPVAAKNTISAVVAGKQSVTDGQQVKLRTTEPMWVGNRLIPRNTVIVGMGRLQGERLEIAVTTIELEGSIYEVELSVFDSDGQEGINIPNSMESDALHEIGANMGSTMGSSINISTDAGAQIASEVGRGLINGVSQYLTKKMRTVKVHLKAGYKVMLHQPED